MKILEVRGTLSTNMIPKRDTMRSNRRRGSRRLMSATRKRTLRIPRLAARRRATAIMGAATSMPNTLPRGPTQRAIASAGSPLPQARSSTRWPGLSSAARSSTGFTGASEC